MSLSQAGIVQQDQQQYSISGEVDFSTVPDLARQSLGLFKESCKANGKTGKSTSITVDMSQLAAANSAGLALMFEMVKDAQSNNIELHFDNLPDTLRTIAKAYGVEKEIRDFCR